MHGKSRRTNFANPFSNGGSVCRVRVLPIRPDRKILPPKNNLRSPARYSQFGRRRNYYGLMSDKMRVYGSDEFVTIILLYFARITVGLQETEIYSLSFDIINTFSFLFVNLVFLVISGRHLSLALMQTRMCIITPIFSIFFI